MERFVDRLTEMNDLNELLSAEHGQLIALYGRRRAGKTTLLSQWMQQAKGWSHCYWVARRETPDAARQSLARAVWQWAYPETDNPEPPLFSSWELLFREMARLIGDKPTILVFDEFPYAMESDESLASHVQAAWDHLFKNKRVILILSGSHIGMMVDLNQYNAPLYGRFTAQFPIDPLPFSALKEFFPAYSPVDRLGVFACLGGIPAYLERFDPKISLQSNIQKHLSHRTGMFRNEPTVLISDLIRETRVYESILRAVADDKNTVTAIAEALKLETSGLSPYLNRLVELRLLDRRIPATIPLAWRKKSKQTRYHLRDSFLRFHYRFIEQNLETIEMGNPEALWARIKSQFNSFVGATVFEDLCRDWIRAKAGKDGLPWFDMIGSHWSAREQIDVTAVNWQEKVILFGECKWVDDGVPKEDVDKFMQASHNVVPGPDWRVLRYFFARRGLSPAAWKAAQACGIQMIVMEDIDDFFTQNAS